MGYHTIRRIVIFLFAVLITWGKQYILAAESVSSAEVQVSSTPLGSPFYRHLAFDFNQDIKKLSRYEKRGFGRAEILTLLLLSQITGTPLKDYGNRRLENKVTLSDLTQEAGLNYVTLYKIVEVLKNNLEAKGSNGLPPPVYGHEEKTEMNVPGDPPQEPIQLEGDEKK